MTPTKQPGIIGLPTFLGVLVVLIVGGAMAVAGTVTWDTYYRDASILIGLLAVGHGIDSRSRP